MRRTAATAPIAALLAAICVAMLSACPPPDGDVDGGTDAGGDAGVVTDPPIITPNEAGWWRDDVFYEVFVRSFYDSNAAGDGIGDLAGVTAKLDYLNDGNAATATDLGVNGIWLMPIFPSPSYHGYDVTDYRSIESDYGTLADFDALIAAAHARGLKVIIDLVLNHTSDQHPWFVSARQGPTAPYRNFYVWRDTKPTGWPNPVGSGEIWHPANGSYYYGLYWSGMPDLNWRNPEVEAEMVAVMKFWLARGVDGFRVDAARYLVESDTGANADQPETHEVFQRLRHAIHQDYPQALLLAEAWASFSTVAQYYGDANEFQLAFSFEVADNIRNSVKKGTRADINQANYLASTVFVDRGFEAPFLTNHDHQRVMRELMAGATEPAWAKAKLAAALLMSQPGTPFVYYGEELGMAGGNARDEDKRTPFRWDATARAGFTASSTDWYETAGFATTEAAAVNVADQQADPDSLWSVYRRLIALRASSPALATGAMTRPAVTGGNSGTYAVLRTAATGQSVLAVFNLSSQTSGGFTLPVTGNATLLEGGGLTGSPTSQSGVLSFPGLDPQSFAFFSIQ